MARPRFVSKRMGKIRTPFYRVVVADSRTKRDGRTIEEIGSTTHRGASLIILTSTPSARSTGCVRAPTDQAVVNLLKITGDWQAFRGERAGQVDPRKVAPAKPSKKEAREPPSPP